MIQGFMRINTPRLPSFLLQPPYSAESNSISQAQLHLDQLWETFSHEAINSIALASMTMGSVAYRLVRMSTLQAGASLAGSGLLRLAPQVAAPLLSLSAEVTVFEGSHRFFSSLTHGFQINESFSEAWRKSWVNFFMLKSVGHLLGTQNLFLRHLSQDGAVVAGHYATGFLGWTPLPEEGLGQQLLQAEAMNLSLHTGGMLLQGALGGRLSILERALEAPRQTLASFAWQRGVTRMAAEPIEQRPVNTLIDSLRSRWSREAQGELFRRLVRVDLDGDTFVRVFETLEAASHRASRPERLVALGGVLETADFSKAGPRALFIKKVQESLEDKMVAVERGWGANLLSNRSLAEADRLKLADVVGEIWRAEGGKKWKVDLIETQSRALEWSREALELEHVEDSVLARIVENALRFAEENSYWFVRLENYGLFVEGVLKSKRVSENEQQRLVDIYANLMTRSDLNLFSGERIFMLEALERIAGDADVPPLLRGYVSMKLRQNAPSVLPLAAGEFTASDVVTNDELVCSTLLRPDLPREARQNLLISAYANLVASPPRSTFAHGYSRTVDFARQHLNNPLYDIENRLILTMMLLKADIDLASLDSFIASFDNKHVGESLRALRAPVKEALREASNEEKTSFALTLTFHGDVLKGLEVPGISLDQFLRQLIFYIRDRSALRAALPARNDRRLSTAVNERLSLVRQILDAG